MKPQTVLLADDQTLFRKALGALLASSASFKVVGEAADAVEKAE